MSHESLLDRFPRHIIVSGRVLKVLGSGLMVSVDDVQGFIPNRELSWEHVDHPRLLVQENQEIEALVLGEDRVRHHLLLSRRLALPNSWQTIKEEFEPGTLRRGYVRQIVSYGAFIELRAGLDGLAHLSEIPKQERSDLPIELWAGDQVLVEVLQVDPSDFRISLSLRSVIERRNQHWAHHRIKRPIKGAALAEGLGTRVDPLEHIAEPWYDPAGLVHHILLVDDDAPFRTHTAEWLYHLGYPTTAVSSVAEAQALVTDPKYTLLLLDYELNDGTGLELAAQAAEHNPNARIVLLSARVDERLCLQGPKIPGLVCWNKPFSTRDFAALLRVLKSGTCPLCQHHSAEGITVTLIPQGNHDQPTLASLDRLCATALEECMQCTGAAVGLVCGVQTGRQRVEVIAHAGAGLALQEADLQQLAFSPIYEICVQGAVIRTADMRHEPARFRYLRPLGPFASFLGLPLRVYLEDMQLGLVLFHRQADYFSEQHRQQVEIRAGFLALALERRHLLHSSLMQQQTILAGRLSLGLAHEVQKQIGGLGAQVEALTMRLQKMRRQEIMDYPDMLARGVPDLAVNMQRSVRSIGEILRRQLNFARPYVMSAFDINTLVERTAEMLRPVAVRDLIYITHTLDRQIPRIYSAKLLVQQILLNLAFNAIQQMAAAGLTQGVLLITTEYRPESSQPVRVLFSDCGPGIHAAHYDRLFQYGFTTSINGTGQGLSLSRAAAVALAGSLDLVDSFVGYGSTFELALPLDGQEAVNG